MNEEEFSIFCEKLNENENIKELKILRGKSERIKKIIPCFKNLEKLSIEYSEVEDN